MIFGTITTLFPFTTQEFMLYQMVKTDLLTACGTKRLLIEIFFLGDLFVAGK